ncbi:MAG: hypothetical protein ACI4DY_06610, partial [Monoglobaceae bacterium]
LNIVDSGLDTEREEAVTRGQFASWTVGLINQREIAKSCTQQQFADVIAAHMFFAEVNYLKCLGYISGVSGTYFEPDRAITTPEALKILLNVMGYGDIAELQNSDAACIRMAIRTGLLPSYDATSGNSLRVSDAVRLLYRALTEADYLRTEGILYKDETEQSSYVKSTVLKEVFHVTENEGIVDANVYTSLTSIDGTNSAEMICIDGKPYTAHTLNAMLYLGYNVRYYTTEDDEIIAMWERGNRVLTLTDEDIDGYENLHYKYTDSVGREKSAVLDEGYDLIYNNKCSKEGYNSGKYIPNTGTVTLIDNNNDRRYDVVLTQNYTYRVVKEMGKRIVTFFTPDNSDDFKCLDLDDKTREFLFVDEDNNVSRDFAFAKGYICSIIESEPDAAGNTLCEVFVSNRNQDKVLSAFVTGLEYDESGEIEYAVLSKDENETKYRITDKVNRSGLFTLRCGITATFYIGPDSTVIAAETAKDQKLIGLFINSFYYDGIDKMKIGMLRTDGKVVLFSCEDALKISSPAAEGSAERKTKIEKDAKTASETLNAIGREVPVLYTLNEEGEISSIELPALCERSVAEQASGLHSLTNGNFRRMQFIKNASSFTDVSGVKDESGIVPLAYAPVIFFIQEPGSGMGTLPNDKRYRVGSIADFTNSETRIDLYSVSDGGTVGDIIVQYRNFNEITDTTAFCAVESVSEIYEDEESKIRIDLWIDKIKQVAYTDDYSVLKDLKSGDLIQASITGKQLYSYRKILSYDEEAGRPYLDNTTFNTNDKRTMWHIGEDTYSVSNDVKYSLVNKYVFGIAYQKKNASIIVAADMEEAQNKNLTSTEVTSLKKHTYNLVYDSEKKIWAPSIPEDVIDYKSAGDKASYVFSWANYLLFNNLFIYN